MGEEEGRDEGVVWVVIGGIGFLGEIKHRFKAKILNTRISKSRLHTQSVNYNYNSGEITIH